MGRQASSGAQHQRAPHHENRSDDSDRQGAENVTQRGVYRTRPRTQNFSHDGIKQDADQHRPLHNSQSLQSPGHCKSYFLAFATLPPEYFAGIRLGNSWPTSRTRFLMDVSVAGGSRPHSQEDLEGHRMVSVGYIEYGRLRIKRDIAPQTELPGAVVNEIALSPKRIGADPVSGMNLRLGKKLVFVDQFQAREYIVAFAKIQRRLQQIAVQGRTGRNLVNPAPDRRCGPAPPFCVAQG